MRSRCPLGIGASLAVALGASAVLASCGAARDDRPAGPMPPAAALAPAVERLVDATRRAGGALALPADDAEADAPATALLDEITAAPPAAVDATAAAAALTDYVQLLAATAPPKGGAARVAHANAVVARMKAIPALVPAALALGDTLDAASRTFAA